MVDDPAARLHDGRAWREFCERLQSAGERLLTDGFPDSARDRAEGHRFLTRLLRFALAMELEHGDPRHPVFQHYEEPHLQWGGPNPDNVYLRAAVDPAQGYRVWGDVGGVRQAIFSLHEGDFPLGEFGVWGERSLDDLAVGEDGSLEITLAAGEQPGNWIPMPPGARLFTIRIYQADWERDAAPVFRIERVGGEGVPPPPPDPARTARALDRAGIWIERSLDFWNRYARSAWERGEPNRPSVARTPPGGAADILYGSCSWELADDEALLLCCEPPEARYWGFSIHTLAWLESGDFADRQTSLNSSQAHVDADGRVRLVLAHADPGVPNWIDTEGRRRGLLVYRWVWSRTNPCPEARLLKLDEVRGALPGDHPRVDATARRRSLARRRAAAWSRTR